MAKFLSAAAEDEPVDFACLALPLVADVDVEQTKTRATRVRRNNARVVLGKFLLVVVEERIVSMMKIITIFHVM